jgi:uncharacterized protein
MKTVLLDTGVVVALLDRSERYHKACVKVVKSLSATLITCEAVIAESCYLLRDQAGAVDAILQNVEAGIFQVPFDIMGCAREVRTIVKKYTNVPMDFADACLVYLAGEFSTARILTLDSDFLVYRWGKNKTFENLIPLDVSEKSR